MEEADTQKSQDEAFAIIKKVLANVPPADSAPADESTWVEVSPIVDLPSPY